MPPDPLVLHADQGTWLRNDDIGGGTDNTHFKADDAVVTLGLDASDIEASVYDMLSTSKRRKAAVLLKGEGARHFLDILQTVRVLLLLLELTLT